MIEIKPIPLATASQLLDFAGRSDVARSGAATQLEGAVAIHNILAGGRVAYLADEVGMGKTFVVLGTLALLRHYHPALRSAVHRAQGEPATQMEQGDPQLHREQLRVWTMRQVVPGNARGLAGVVREPARILLRESALDAHRDFILRLSSFSLPLSRSDGGGRAWKEKAEELRRVFPGLAETALEVDGRTSDAHEQRKDAFACAVNEVLPHFDLLVLDEGHNLKHGFQGARRCRDQPALWPTCWELRRGRRAGNLAAAWTVRSCSRPRPSTTVTATCGTS